MQRRVLRLEVRAAREEARRLAVLPRLLLEQRLRRCTRKPWARGCRLSHPSAPSPSHPADKRGSAAPVSHCGAVRGSRSLEPACPVEEGAAALEEVPRRGEGRQRRRLREGRPACRSGPARRLRKCGGEGALPLLLAPLPLLLVQESRALAEQSESALDAAVPRARLERRPPAVELQQPTACGRLLRERALRSKARGGEEGREREARLPAGEASGFASRRRSRCVACAGERWAAVGPRPPAQLLPLPALAPGCRLRDGGLSLGERAPSTASLSPTSSGGFPTPASPAVS